MTVPVQPQGKRLSFVYGEDRIEVLRLARTEGIKRVLIKVHPDCRVMVSAPPAASRRQKWSISSVLPTPASVASR